MSAISLRLVGALSGSWRERSQAITRYQPSPNGARNAKPFSLAPTVSTSSGVRSSRTSASSTELTTDSPGNGMPSRSRTVLWTPSVPTA